MIMGEDLAEEVVETTAAIMMIMVKVEAAKVVVERGMGDASHLQEAIPEGTWILAVAAGGLVDIERR
jgi:hypothetical protein